MLPEESTVKLVNLLISLVLVCAGVFMLNCVKAVKKPAIEEDTSETN